MFQSVFPPESRKFLLYARQIEIRGVDIDNPYYNYIIPFTVPDIDNVTVVDYDAVEHRIYWSDVRTQTIKRAFINGTGVETVVSAGKNIHKTDVHTHTHTLFQQACPLKQGALLVTYLCIMRSILSGLVSEGSSIAI